MNAIEDLKMKNCNSFPFTLNELFIGFSAHIPGKEKKSNGFSKYSLWTCQDVWAVYIPTNDLPSEDLSSFSSLFLMDIDWKWVFCKCQFLWRIWKPTHCSDFLSFSCSLGAQNYSHKESFYWAEAHITITIRGRTVAV